MDIKFKDLSGWLQTAIVMLWIMIGLNALTLFIGFIVEVARW